MMRMSTKTLPPPAAGGPETALPPMKNSSSVAQWEVRPCGMLVQKRGSDAEALVPTIRLRVKHDSNYHEICIRSQATFGELKKLLEERTGLHRQDQKILFKDKERDSASYLDRSGVKDRSKLVVVKDQAAQARRLLEMRRAANVDKVLKSISQISLDVDKLASQVSALEAVIVKGGKVTENEVVSLIELLMNELLKLDGVVADGDARLQRRMQVRRVQKHVEKLDMIKLKNAMPTAHSRRVTATAAPPQPQSLEKKQYLPSPQPPPVIVSTKWETFDSLFSPRTFTSTSAATADTSTTTSAAALTPRFEWELF